nr:hypothetical protein [Sulfurovaceae bacterium]
VQKYSPYYLDKRLGGLQIMSREDKDFKEKPSNINVFHLMDKLEKDWGKTHLRLNTDTLIIMDNNASDIAIIKLNNKDEIQFVNRFYGIR